MTRRLVFLTGVLLVATTSAAVAFRVAPPGPSTLAAHVIALTAPEMEGRASGTVGAERAARYIVDRFAAAGLRAGGRAGVSSRASSSARRSAWVPTARSRGSGPVPPASRPGGTGCRTVGRVAER